MNAMRTLIALVLLIVLGAASSANALTSQPAHAPSFQHNSIGPALVVRRLGRPYRHHYREYRYHGPRQYRQFVEPQTRAAPMQRVPQVAPLAPRVGR
jgi:hypothetical protein